MSSLSHHSIQDEEVGRKYREHELVLEHPDENTPDDQGTLATQENPPTIGCPRWQRLLHQTLLPDTKFSYGDYKIVDGVEAVRFLKFFSTTIILILAIYGIVRALDWEHDIGYSLGDLFLYDLPLVALDVISFFVVGRLFMKNGVDHIAWCLVVFLSAFYTAWTTTFEFLRHSLTLYDMHCTWPASLWVYAVVCVVIISVFVWRHVRYAIRHRDVIVKLTELTLTALLFIVPQVTNDSFQFHHWYAGWLIGMHLSYDVWWSRLAMAWCWGMYVNGIAVYGRDPTLTCGYGYFVSIGCSYMYCNLKPGVPSNGTHTGDDYVPLPTRDWRNCET